MKPLPPQAYLHEHFDYNPEVGIFIWKKVYPPNTRLIGRAAGTPSSRGYIVIGVPEYGRFGAHRLAWFYVHGASIGEAQIDHIDGNPSNNSIMNLRLATPSQQQRNRGGMSCSKSGLKGAHYIGPGRTKKWGSAIKVGGRSIFLGSFACAEDANTAYAAAALKYFGEFARSQ
jgi:hypothetical protein